MNSNTKEEAGHVLRVG
jgi:hippurate hydrolase